MLHKTASRFLVILLLGIILSACGGHQVQNIVSDEFAAKCRAFIPTAQEVAIMKAEGQIPLLLGCLNHEGEPDIDISVDPDYVNDDEITFYVRGDNSDQRNRGLALVQSLCPAQNLSWTRWSDDPRDYVWGMTDTNVSCLPDEASRTAAQQEACKLDPNWSVCPEF